ncbi:MAG: aldo/keto reductase [Caldilineaceae bacterium]
MPFTFPIPKLGLGAAPLGSPTPDSTFGEVSEAAAIATVQRCLEQGVTFFDTAPLYGAGLSESRLGMALQGVPRSQYQIATKIGFLAQEDGSVVRDYSRDAVLRSIEASFARLQIDYAEIVHIHDLDHHLTEALDHAFPPLLELKEQGVIGAIGSGVNTWQPLVHLARHAPFDCFLLAGRYTLLEQEPLAELFPLCSEKGIRIILGGVFNTGILAAGARSGAHYQYGAPPQEIIEKTLRIEAVCERHGVPLKAAALQFAIAHPVVATLAVGMKKPSEVDENVAAFQTPIPPAFWQELRSLSLIDPTAPLPQ